MPTIKGTANAERLVGTSNSEEIYGEGGDDHIVCYGGNDTAFGGEGKDEIEGGDGVDMLFGDAILLSQYNEAIDAAGGYNDTIKGGKHDDFLYGDWGNDKLYGGTDTDFLSGDEGDDKLYGEDGNDTLTGGLDADTFHFFFDPSQPNGIDVVKDFNRFQLGEVIHFHGSPANLNSFNELLAATTNVGNGCLIDMGGGNSVFLENVREEQLLPNDFLFL